MTTWTIKKISDAAYFKVGDIFNNEVLAPAALYEDLVVSNSLIKQVLDRNMFHLVTHGLPPVDDKLQQEVFNPGSAFHCHLLEHEEFTDRYHVSNVPDPSRDETIINEVDMSFIKGVYENTEIKYPDLLDGEYVELALFGEIDGVKVKCKIDKLKVVKSGNRYLSVEIIDLKGVWFDFWKQKKDQYKSRWELRKKLSANGYDLQAYFYKKLVEAWLQSIGQFCPVDFTLAVASKETHDIQKFKIGAEMMESGEAKFRSVWGEISDFAKHGHAALIDEEEL